MTKLKFLGAAGTVTGSSYLLDISEDDQNVKIMIDHGLFQGPDVEHLNAEKYPFDPSDIDLLLVTHTHIDHCGRIPRLVREGFRGEIWCTKQTAEIMELILLDGAKIQAIKQRDEGIAPLYDKNDVYDTFDLVSIIEADVDYDLGSMSVDLSNVTVKAERAGHILGAVSYHLNIGGKAVTFSGDIGRSTQDLILGFSDEKSYSNYVVMEALYGGKYHEDKEEMVEHFRKHINRTLDRNGNVIIPAFSVQRTQEILFVLNKLVKQGMIRNNVEIYLDSPLARGVTNIYTSNMSEIDQTKLHPFQNIKEAIYSSNLTIIKKFSQSKKLSQKKGVIIIAGSGLINGGKVLFYLKKMIENPTNMLAVVGYQAEETLGREIIEGAKEIEIDEEVYKVNIDVQEFKGFSAHADQSDLLRWLKKFDRETLQNIFLVHANPEQSSAFSEVLLKEGYKNYIPRLADDIEI